LYSKFIKNDESKKKYKNSIWVSKNAEFHADLKSVEKVYKIYKKSSKQKRDGGANFFHF
jgi:hypothetical protein